MKLRSCLLVLAASALAACATTTGEAPTGPAPTPVIIVVTATPTATPEALTYAVRQGDTLGRIARAFDVTVAELVELNGIEDANRISVGQVLFIPRATEPSEAAAPPTATPDPPEATVTLTPLPTDTASPTTVPTVTPTESATATPTVPLTATSTREMTATATVPSTATSTAVASATATAPSTATAVPTKTSTATKAPTFAPTPTFLPTATRTPAPTATPRPTPTMPASEGAGVNLTPEDEALSAAMQVAMAPHGVQRVVIADAREQGGARVAIGTLILTQEQESGGEQLSLPMGAIFAAAYRVASLMGAAEDLDSVAVVVASSEGNATALVGARTADVRAFVEGSLNEADFVRLWVVRDF